MSRQSVCAVIPAAGTGSRLGGQTPKILLSLARNLTVWEVLAARLAPEVSRIHVVLSPRAVGQFERHLVDHPNSRLPEVTVGIQDSPRGMGDAIFGARRAWSGFDSVLVVWGDQVCLSTSTVRRTLAQHGACAGPTVTLPLVMMPCPYVQYLFEPSHKTLLRVLQSREGDRCADRGEADVGVFCLTTERLAEHWDRYVADSGAGAQTGEVNFLPFLAHLSSTLGWAVRSVVVTDPIEARGINTAEDLAFFRREFSGAG